MRIPVRTLLFLLLVAGLGGGLWWLGTPAAPQERSLQMTVVSPDGVTQARVYGNFWSGALAVNSSRVETIELLERGEKSASAPSTGRTFARYDMERGAVVAVLWRDARDLVIVTSANARPLDAPRSVSGISVEVVRYDAQSAEQVACIDAFNRIAAAGPVTASPAACLAFMHASA